VGQFVDFQPEITAALGSTPAVGSSRSRDGDAEAGGQRERCFHPPESCQPVIFTMEEAQLFQAGADFGLPVGCSITRANKIKVFSILRSS